MVVERITGPDCWVGFKVGVPCLTLTQCQNLKSVSNTWVEGDPVVQKMLEWGEQLLAPRASELAAAPSPLNASGAGGHEQPAPQHKADADAKHKELTEL